MLAGALLMLMAAAQPGAAGAPVTGAEAVRFLCEAEVVEVERYDSPGITEPRRAILRDGDVVRRAVFKDYHEYEPVKVVRGGERIVRFRDSYLHEVAAYELSELLGLGLVPATVLRSIGMVEGSLQLWVEGAMTEARRLDEGLRPPDLAAWSRKMATLNAFLRLIGDIDYRNANNILVTDGYEVLKIDSSRAFRWDPDLREPAALNRFPRTMVERLRGLDRDALRRRMAPYLEEGQVDALLARGAAMLELVDRRIAERGEKAVLFP